jgi:hypothetical protein
MSGMGLRNDFVQIVGQCSVETLLDRLDAATKLAFAFVLVREHAVTLDFADAVDGLAATVRTEDAVPQPQVADFLLVPVDVVLLGAGAAGLDQLEGKAHVVPLGLAASLAAFSACFFSFSAISSS